MAPHETDPLNACYAVIFSSQRTGVDAAAYGEAADRMMQLARQQPGFLGVESARSADGFGITVSYWETREAIHDWRRQIEHLAAQQRGRERWYASYTLRVARVEQFRSFAAPQLP